MKKYYILFTLLFSLRINAMEEAPKQSDIFPLLDLPSDVQNIIGSYVAEDDQSLIQRLSNKVENDCESESAFLELYKNNLLNKSLFNFVIPENTSSDIFNKLRDIHYQFWSCDSTKCLFVAKIELYGSYFADRIFFLYDILTRSVYVRRVQPNQHDLGGIPFFKPSLISNDGRIIIFHEWVSTYFANLDMLRIKKDDREKTCDLQLRGRNLDALRINKQNTKIVASFHATRNPPVAKSSIAIFSRKLPQKDPNYPENLLGRYFREIGVCKTLSVQNSNLKNINHSS